MAMTQPLTHRVVRQMSQGSTVGTDTLRIPSASWHHKLRFLAGWHVDWSLSSPWQVGSPVEVALRGLAAISHFESDPARQRAS